jgi:hypothetical protein
MRKNTPLTENQIIEAVQKIGNPKFINTGIIYHEIFPPTKRFSINGKFRTQTWDPYILRDITTYFAEHQNYRLYTGKGRTPKVFEKITLLEEQL